MRKEKYIIERKGKKGTTFQIFIPGPPTFTKSVRSADYYNDNEALKAAIKIRDKALLDMSLGQLITDSMTVAELFESMKDLFPSSKRSKDRYQAFYNKGIKGKDIELKQIEKVTPAELQINVNKYAADHSQDQINHYVGIWRKIYRAAQMNGIPVTDKTLMLIVPKSKMVSSSRTVDISTEDLSRFLDFVRNYNLYDDKGRHRAEMVYRVLLTMYYTGIRPQEARALTVSDVQGDWLRINKSMGSTIESEEEVITTKTEGSKRMVPIAAPLREALKEWTTGKKKNELLFPDYYGVPFTSDYFANYIRRVSRKCGIEFRAYMLRHKFATDLVKKTDLRTVQELMGHAGGSMTLSYARSSKEDKEEAINKR